MSPGKAEMYQIDLDIPRQVYVNGVLVFEGWNVPFVKLARSYDGIFTDTRITGDFLVYHMKSPLDKDVIRAMSCISKNF
ncbi:MAG: hypothetical protein HYU56_02140 [Candidatus Aenigmarchaeota archaeon]|nr:hypothetical protein [Candidatus Aenigmarchaeota archaeon]